MKTFLLFGALALSLAANVWLASSRGMEVLPPFSPKAAPPTQIFPVQPTGSAERAITWTSLQADGDDLPKLVAGLRAAGFPGEVVRAIAATQINLRATVRRNQIYNPFAVPFWKATVPTPAQMMKLRALTEEGQAALTSLGLEPLSQTELAVQHRRYGNLPGAKIAQLEKISLDYADMLSVAAKKENRISGVSFEEQRQLLNIEQRKDLVALLTPAELAEYDLHHSGNAAVLGNHLQEIDVSEDEYRALFHILQLQDQAHPVRLGLQTPEMLEDLVVAQHELHQQLLSTLGNERFLKYLSADSSYRDLASFAETGTEINGDKILALLDLQNALNSALGRATQQPGQTPEDRRFAANQVRAEFRARLAAHLSPEQLTSFLKGNFGQMSFVLRSDMPPPKP